ncbi:cytochrome oxidase assembly protein ShyY1 [Afipia massiliensis]|uniref:SURF1-like protein n=1 Tax=Afipia massiliensis TaxID=211460 RepID=A0A840N039_9BRAD|nr:SURF1 family cytochrome oxidase biogenesis protein [Afipia massiliensis]MBB5052380.1 cytochrome oxidase assembly protein ShyY1 [Afipia massiliensis]
MNQLNTIPSTRQRGVFGLAVIALIMVSVLASLGVWQLRRKDEKHALIAALTERLAKAPVALPPAASWPTLLPAHDEFSRVRFSATFEAKPDAMVYSSGSAVRDDITGPGTWAFMPARLADGRSVVINAGFVQNTMQDRAQQDRAVTRLVTGAPVELTGYLRFPEEPGTFTPKEDSGKRLWFVRDHQSMAQVLGWGEVAPFYVDLESPQPASGTPKPGPLHVQLKDNHLQYAITWFGLALVVAAAFGFWVAGQRRA